MQYGAAWTIGSSYDANGNLTSDGSTSFTYDMENRLVAASGAKGANLRYDPLGRLYEVNGPFGLTRFIYDGDHVAAEYNSAGTVLRRYMWGPGHDEPILWDEGSAVNCSGGKFLHPDRQGSVVAAADCAGALIGINKYDEYGIPQSGNTGRFQYTGQAWLPELGMYYYKARIYSPTLGRFLQTDPIGYGDGLNWYAYVGSDPVNGIDPSGLAEVFDGPAIDVIGSGNKPCPEETVAAGGGYCIPASIYYGGINPGFASDNRAPIGGATAGLAKGSGYKSQSKIPPCPKPSAAAMQGIVNEALGDAGGGGRASSYTTGYTALSQRPNVRNASGSLGQGWYSAANSHGSQTTSYQYDLGTSGYSLKVYFNDGKNGGRDTAALVSTNSIAHAVDAAAVLLGAVDNDLMNFNLGVAYLREVGSCK